MSQRALRVASSPFENIATMVAAVAVPVGNRSRSTSTICRRSGTA